jgi:hypothetical protein
MKLTRTLAVMLGSAGTCEAEFEEFCCDVSLNYAPVNSASFVRMLDQTPGLEICMADGRGKCVGVLAGFGTSLGPGRGLRVRGGIYNRG